MWDFLDVLCTSISRRKLRDFVIDRGLVRETYQMMFYQTLEAVLFQEAIIHSSCSSKRAVEERVTNL